MFCTQCGTQLDDSARFCIACGKPTAAEPSPQYNAPQYNAPQYNAPQPAPAAPHYESSSATAAPPRRLRKIVAQKKIAGVCAGFAEFFDIDVTLMRIIWVALLLLPPHIGLIAYIVSMFVLPKG